MMEPLELVRNVTTRSGEGRSRPPTPFPPRHPQRRASSHIYPPDWLFRIKPPHGSRRFSLRMDSLGRMSTTKLNDDSSGEDLGAQTTGVPEIDATSSIPLDMLGGNPPSPTSPLPPTTPGTGKRHSAAWNYLHSIVTTNTTVSSPSSQDTATLPSSPTTVSDTPLPVAMPNSAAQASPAMSGGPLPSGVGSTLAPELSPPVFESPAPPSAHDAVVDSLLQRPPIVHRSNSTPATQPPVTDLHRTLSGNDTADTPPQRSGSEVDSRLVSAMLNGPLDAGGGRVTRALGSQIEAVLSAQVEIGRAHLALEGIGAVQTAGLNLVNPTTPGEEGTEKGAEAVAADEADLARRQQGVEDIMARLSELATSLKSYHAIGTPALIFPPTLPRRPITAPNVGAPKPRMPFVTIASPEIARNESVPTSTDSLPVPDARTAFPTTSTAASTANASPLSPTGPGLSPTGPGLPRATRDAALWLRKTAANANAAVAVASPTEMTPTERQRPW